MSHVHHTSHVSPHHMDHSTHHTSPHMSPHHMSPHHMAPVHHHMIPQEDTPHYITIGFVVFSILLGLIAIVLGGLAVSGNINFFKVEASGNISSDNEITAKGVIASETGFDVGQTKFTVDKDGNTIVAGSLAVESPSAFFSDVSINTDKFVVRGTTGDTTISGTLDVTGVTKIGSRIFQKGSIGAIPNIAEPTISAELMLDNTLLNSGSSTPVTAAVWDTGSHIDTNLEAKGITLANGLFFDVNINNNSSSVFTLGALPTGIISGSGAATSENSQIPIAVAGLSPVGIFRFYRTGTGTYTVYCLSMAAT